MAAGRSIKNEYSRVLSYIEKENAIVISINYPHNDYECDFLYFNNTKKYQTYIQGEKKYSVICTSNIKQICEKNEYIISFSRLIKCGWENMDNSTILLLRLLNILDVKKVGIAGFDGYSCESNYAKEEKDYRLSAREVLFINKELSEMFDDFLKKNQRIWKLK